jgi:hypothetical protein
MLSASTTVKAAAEPRVGKAEASEARAEERGMTKPEASETRVEKSGVSKTEASETGAEKRAAEATVEASSKCNGNSNRPAPGLWPTGRAIPPVGGLRRFAHGSGHYDTAGLILFRRRKDVTRRLRLEK